MSVGSHLETQNLILTLNQKILTEVGKYTFQVPTNFPHYGSVLLTALALKSIWAGYVHNKEMLLFFLCDGKLERVILILSALLVFYKNICGSSVHLHVQSKKCILQVS